MFVRWTGCLSLMRRWLSRGEWAVRLLGIPRSTADAGSAGLVLIQIDGLSQSQFERAVDAGRMPFMRRLLTREQHRNLTLYSGMPSSTPSVQGELFYGVQCATPAFSYFSGDLQREVSMSEPEAAISVEARVSRNCVGLLQGGSAYCDIYNGGAEETHFCACDLGFGGFVQSVNPARMIFIAFWYSWSFVRAFGLTMLELALAIGGFFHGSLTRGEFWRELRFVPARVAIVILLRELVTIGATLDVARGLPIVHLNLLGYDEQAHRRGPESAFAHWTLKGIDRAIRVIWFAAQRSHTRDYDVWIYSDHGQESTTPYEDSQHRTIEETVAQLMLGIPPNKQGVAGANPAAPTSDRARWISKGPLARRLFASRSTTTGRRKKTFMVVANGPIGLVYLPAETSEDAVRTLAKRLSAEGGCPLVFVSHGDTQVCAYRSGREYLLPNDAPEVFGAHHPFLEDIVQDTIKLVRHPDCGELVISGWKKEGRSLSFPAQHGAHAGPGPEETRAFVVIPADAPLPITEREYLRPSDLRCAVQDFFGGNSRPQQRQGRKSPGVSHGLRVMTHHAGLSWHGQPSSAAATCVRNRTGE